MIDWAHIFYGTTLSTLFAAVVFVFIGRERTPAVLAPALAATVLGPLAWNAIPHRAATDAFFVDIPFKPFSVSWQDTGWACSPSPSAHSCPASRYAARPPAESSASLPPARWSPSSSTSTCIDEFRSVRSR